MKRYTTYLGLIFLIIGCLLIGCTKSPLQNGFDEERTERRNIVPSNKEPIGKPKIKEAEEPEFKGGNFYEACALATEKQVKKLLEKEENSANKLDSNGFSPLMWAVLGKDPKIFSDSIDNIIGALKNANDDDLYKNLKALPTVKGNRNVVELLLQNGANVQLTDRNKRSVMVYAALFCNDESIVTSLVNGGGSFDETLTINYPTNVLSFASFTNQNEKVIKVVANAGKNVYKDNEFGTTPIQWAAMYAKNPKVIDALISTGADVNDASHKDGYSPLIWAVRCNRNVEVVKHLLELGAKVTTQDKNGHDAIDWAVLGTPSDFVKTLNGFNYNNTNRAVNLTKLKGDLKTIAKKGARPDITGLLVEHCTDTNIITKALMWSIFAFDKASYQKLMDQHGSKMKYEASFFMDMPKWTDNVDCIEILYKRFKDKLSAADNANALIGNNLPVLKLLHTMGVTIDFITLNQGFFINYGKDTEYGTYPISLWKEAVSQVGLSSLEQKDSNGNTLLYNAINANNTNAVKALIECGANVNATIGSKHRSILICAVSKEYPSTEIVKTLLNNGANVNARDDDGASALIYAVNKNKKPDVATLLINAGAAKDAMYDGDYVYKYCNSDIKKTSVYSTLKDAVNTSWWLW